MNYFDFDGTNINLLVAFISGFITFFASCLLPLVPTYLGYLSGVALNSDDAENKRWQILKTALLFVTGFIVTFVILGLTLNKLSFVMAPYRKVIEKLSGLLFITLGLFMMGVFKHRLFSQERKININKSFTKNKSIHTLLAGAAFGFSWTPCIGPVLAVILYWSAQASSMWKGVSLLVTYGMGLGLPFILIAIAFEKLIPILKKYSKISKYVTYLSGIIVIIAGLMLLGGRFQDFSKFTLHTFNLNILAK